MTFDSGFYGNLPAVCAETGFARGLTAAAVEPVAKRLEISP